MDLGPVYHFIAPLIIGILMAVAMAAYTYYRLPRPVPNDSLGSAIAETPKLIAKARRELKIVSGSLYPSFYNDERISRSLEAAVRRGVTVKVVCGPRADLSKVPALSDLRRQGLVEIRRLNTEPRPHFMVVDGGRHIRLEAPHPEERLGTVRAMVIYNSVELGREHDRLFDELWNKAQPVKL